MFGAIAGGIASALAGGAMSKLFGGGQKAASGGIQDRKSGSAGMPRPISYAVFCLKKKKNDEPALQDADALPRDAYSQAGDSFGFWAGDYQVRETKYTSSQSPE